MSQSTETFWTTSKIFDRYGAQAISAPPNASMQYEPRRTFDPYVSLGPVIGMVTDTTARILIEVSQDTNVKCFLTDKYGVQHGMSKNMRAGIPAVFNFYELKARTYYKVTFDIPVPGLVKSGFRTLPLNWSLSSNPSRIGVVSTNDHVALREDVKEDLDIWKKLYQSCKKNEIDYIFHLGNNVFVDTDAYKVNSKTGEKTQTRKEHRPTALEHALNHTSYSQDGRDDYSTMETFRQAYRESWLRPTTRHVLANAPNLMILNELEIADGFGHAPPNGTEHLAYAVYREYCRALFEDEPKGRRRQGQAYHFHAFGDMGFVFLDTKAQRNLLDSDGIGGDGSLLTGKQWRDIEYALSPSGYLSDCKVLLVCTPSPICQISERGFMKASAAKKADLSDTWNSPSGVTEGSALLCRLFDWKASLPGEREVVLLAGSNSDGGVSEIVDLRYRASGDIRIERIKQVTAGPLATSAAKSRHPGKLGAVCGMRGYGAYHQFKHTKVFSTPNAALLDFYRDRREKTISVTGSHIVKKGKFLMVIPSCDSNLRAGGCWKREPEVSVQKVAGYRAPQLEDVEEPVARDSYTARTPSY